jgi:hypothetical protein
MLTIFVLYVPKTWLERGNLLMWWMGCLTLKGYHQGRQERVWATVKKVFWYPPSPPPSRATKQRVSYARWPLATSAVDTANDYPITSDTVEKDKNICKIIGARALLWTAGSTLLLTTVIVLSVVPYFNMIIALCTSPLEVLKLLIPSLSYQLTNGYLCVSITLIVITHNVHIGMFCLC